MGEDRVSTVEVTPVLGYASKVPGLERHDDPTSPRGEVGVGGLSLQLDDSAQIWGAGQLLAPAADPIGGHPFAEHLLGDGGLTGHLRFEQRLRHGQADRRPGGECLGPAKTRVVRTGVASGEKDTAVGIEVHDGYPDVATPSDRLQGQLTGMAEDDQPAHRALGSGQEAAPAVTADAVGYLQLPALDGNSQTVAIGDQYGDIASITTEDSLDESAILGQVRL